jgi:hypothetical protein
MKMMDLSINNIPSGTIILVGQYAEPILIVNSRGLGKWGINLNYGPTWYNPNDIIKNILPDQIISSKWILRAKLKLDEYLNGRWYSNLDYVEALAKLKDYEKENS